MNLSELFSKQNPNLYQLMFRRAEDKISTELDSETIILDIESGIYSGLNPVGTAIWNILEEPATIDGIKKALLLQFDVTEDQCLEDLLDFLKKLAEQNLIDIENATP